jgi:hypothetical protein
MNKKNRNHLLRSCAVTALLNELGLNPSRETSSAADYEAMDSLPSA